MKGPTARLRFTYRVGVTHPKTGVVIELTGITSTRAGETYEQAVQREAKASGWSACRVFFVAGVSS